MVRSLKFTMEECCVTYSKTKVVFGLGEEPERYIGLHILSAVVGIPQITHRSSQV